MLNELINNAGGSHFQQLSWTLRLKISLGAASGLAFLHSTETKVIYRDFKTSNILLDTVCIYCKLCHVIMWLNMMKLAWTH